MTPRPPTPRRPEPPASGTAHLRLGLSGEELATRALLAAGYRLVDRNVRTRDGEIDLLLRRRRTLIAVEVKTRSQHPAPERCVDAEQLDRIERALRSLAQGFSPPPRTLRVDVVSVVSRGNDADLMHFPGLRRVARAGLGTNPWGVGSRTPAPTADFMLRALRSDPAPHADPR